MHGWEFPDGDAHGFKSRTGYSGYKGALTGVLMIGRW